jgi:hypothetical protein
MEIRYQICEESLDGSEGSNLRNLGFWEIVWFVLTKMRGRIRQGYQVRISNEVSRR